jgi:hypothetical protein
MMLIERAILPRIIRIGLSRGRRPLCVIIGDLNVTFRFEIDGNRGAAQLASNTFDYGRATSVSGLHPLWSLIGLQDVLTAIDCLLP